jgi:hypothetical protein
MIHKDKERHPEENRNQGGLSPAAQRDLDLANALAKDSLLVDTGHERTELSETSLGAELPRVIEGSITTSDLEAFIKNLLAAQERADAQKMAERLKATVQGINGPDVTAFDANSVYRNLQGWGFHIDPDVFNREVESINARQRVLDTNSQLAEKLGLPKESSAKEIGIEAKLRIAVDDFLKTIADRVAQALADPSSLKEGYLPIDTNKYDEPMWEKTFDLGIRSSASEFMSLGARTTFQEYLARIGFYHLFDVSDPAYANAKLKSPALNELIEGIYKAGAVPEISFPKGYQYTLNPQDMTYGFPMKIKLQVKL